mgnify:FL=1
MTESNNCMNTNHTAIESLRTFALAHGEVSFAHLCTAALNGEAWAVERVESVLERIAVHAEALAGGLSKLTLIRSTDTTNPDGSSSRGGLEF